MADSTRNVLFNGTHLVELAAGGASGAVPVILVTIQYRLGVYGWLGGDALRDTSGATGNWGLMDQRLALRWVRAPEERWSYLPVVAAWKKERGEKCSQGEQDTRIARLLTVKSPLSASPPVVPEPWFWPCAQPPFEWAEP